MLPGLEPVSPDRDEVVMTLVELTRTHPSDQRERYLRHACSQDAQLFDEVWSCVLAEERMGDFLQKPLIPRQEEDRPLKPDDRLIDRFRIVREVGRGGMAFVYEAEDEKLERRIAIKWPKSRFRKRVPPEVRHAREISHPNVCKIFDIHTVSLGGEESDFLSMEFLEGETLAEWMHHGQVGNKEARSIALQLCAGLAEAHRKQVIHGDLKSNNVILTAGVDGSFRAVITDFGLARGPEAIPPAAGTAVRGGTPDYMAPEIWRGEKPSPASDIYALGVILYELSSGRRPFGPEVPAEERIGRKPERVNPEWDRVLGQCLDPDPARRFASADHVTKALVTHSRRRFLAAVAASGAAVATGAATWIYRHGHPGGAIPSVAVLPFINTRATPATEYLSDGISESLINALAQLPGLKVIARSSSFQFRGAGIDVQKTARRLGVQVLVTGRISEIDNQLRITAELVNGADGMQLWGGQYSPRISHLAAVEAQIARDIALQIRSRLSPSEQARLAQGTKAKPEAYELVLRARYLARLHTPATSLSAMSYYQQALAIDPGFALAHAELAHVYRLLGGSAILNAQDMMPQAEAEVRRALAADPNLAEAHAVLADIRKDQWDWAGAEQEYRRTIELSPNLAAARTGFAIYLSLTGRYDQAVSEAQAARELDPLGVPTAVAVAAVHYNARRYAQSLDVLKRALDLDPAAPAAWTWIGIVNGGMGQFAQATEAYEKAVKLGDDTTATQCYYAYSLARSGRRQEALRILQRLQRPGPFVSRAALAATYLGLDQTERALQELEAAYAAHDPLVQYLRVESHFDTLSSDPRFQEICAKIGLPR